MSHNYHGVGGVVGHAAILAQVGVRAKAPRAWSLTGILPSMSILRRRLWLRLPAWASASAFVTLAAVLAALGALPPTDAAWISLSALFALVPSGWVSPVGLRRRAAEACLVPAAATLMLVGDLTIRRMLLPPLLTVAAAAALMAALARSPRHIHPVLVACCGLAIRAATGLGLEGAGLITSATVLVAAAVTPWAATYWGWQVGTVTALLMGTLPLARWPAAAVIVSVIALFLYPWGRVSGRHTVVAARWSPALVALAMLYAAVAPWGGSPATWIFPSAGAAFLIALLLALAVTPRLEGAIVGLAWFLVMISLGPVQGPSPDRRALRLSKENPRLVLPAGTGGRYLLDISLHGVRDLAEGSPVVVVEVQGRTRDLRIGSELADPGRLSVASVPEPDHSFPDRAVWRPSRIGYDASWRLAGRTLLDVPVGVRPVIARHPALSDRVRVTVETYGPASPTPPRDWALPSWLLGTAATVLLLQLGGGTWRMSSAFIPWCLLVVGQAVSRACVEPLRLVGERYAVDLCLAALLAGWLPVAWRWLREGRQLRVVAVLLVPLALATPHLAPPLHGDEPFHLLVMESLAVDHDLDVGNNLPAEESAAEANPAQGGPLFHSPVLGILLLPGYLVGERSGALVMLALLGAVLVALIAARARTLGVSESRIALVTLALATTYPLATFASQIWPELPGATAVAAILVMANGRWLGLLATAVVALVATAIKTRLALVTFPPAIVGWLRGGRRRQTAGLLVLATAAALGLGVGWLAMGHPFGAFRRLRHLVPDDPTVPLRVVAGLLYDAAGGLAFSAPLLLVAVAFLPLLWRRGKDGERAVLVGGALTVVALLHSLEWYGGGSPPARYLVPLLPALALTWGLLLQSPRRTRRLGEVLVAPAVFVWWVLITRPHFSINPGDGGWWLSDGLARRFSADTQRFFPSLLVPNTAAVWFPLIAAGAALVAVWLCRKYSGAARTLARAGIALWLVLCALLAAAVTLRYDRTVELEGPQVQRLGGRPVPPAGTFSQFTYRRGWQLADGDRVTVPLHLPAHASVWLEGWLQGTAQRGAQLTVRWNDGEALVLPVAGSAQDGRLRLPGTLPRGRHRLSLKVNAPPGGAAVLDRVIVEPVVPPLDSEP